MKKPLLTIVFALCSTFMVFGQYTASQHIKAGNKNLEQNKFFSALVNFSRAIEKGESNPELKYNYAVAAEKSHSYGLAASAYEDYVTNADGVNQADALIALANLKQTLGQYEDASRFADLYLSEYGDGPMAMTANKIKKSATWVKEQPTDHLGLEIEHLGREVNSDYVDQAPYEIDGKLYFSSLRFIDGKGYDAGDYTAKILTREGGPLGTTGNFNKESKLTTAPTFSEDGELMIYAVCDYTGSLDIPCQLYSAKKSGAGYGDGTLLSTINDGSSNSQPNLVSNGDGSYTMYFSSNRPGGKGGYDIYYSTMNSEMDFSAPMAVSGVNTAGDDNTPFYHTGTNTLYFSSNGRKGFGGYDLFSANGSGAKFSGAANMGTGYNSSYDDRYFWLNEDGTQGYLVSNREGSFYADDSYETCCYDIWALNIEEPECTMIVNINDCNAGSLAGSNVVVTNINTGEEIYSGTSAVNTMTINRNHSYKITASKDCYGDADKTVGPWEGPGGDDCKEEVDLCLEGEKKQMTACAFDKENSKELKGAEICLVDASNNESQCEKNPTSNCHTYDVVIGKSYKLIAKKAGYIEELASFSASCDDLKKNLYLRRPAVSCLESVIPLRLYFDNDEPNPKSRSTTSSVAYQGTCDNYYSKKEEYKRRYSSVFGFKSDQRVIADADIESFFENDLRRGCDNLNLFLNCLVESLQSGKKVGIALRGYTSPLARDDYNTALAQRRVDSVRKSIHQHQGGILMTYINSGQLTITERSLGETVSPDEVSDSRANRSKSVYSPDAARERRVEIEQVIIN